MLQIRAFIIEDQLDNVTLFEDVLQLANCNVDYALDGIEGLNWLKSNPAPQLIILDMNLPNISGLEIYRAIRQQDKFNNTLIIVASANAPMLDELEPELVEGDYLFLKPVDVMELMGIAKELALQVS